MTDPDLVAKKLALIETYVRELETLADPASVGFRNILVHGYASVDKAVVKDVLENHLGDLVAFVAAIRARLRP